MTRQPSKLQAFGHSSTSGAQIHCSRSGSRASGEHNLIDEFVQTAWRNWTNHFKPPLEAMLHTHTQNTSGERMEPNGYFMLIPKLFAAQLIRVT